TFEMPDYGAGPRSAPTVGRATVTARTIGTMTTYSKPPTWARLLFRLVRDLAPETVLELGSCVGISAAFQAAALHLNGTGRLITLEGAAPLAERTARTLADLCLSEVAEVRVGEFDDTLPDALRELAPVGLSFIDGNHQERPTLTYAD